MKIVFLKHIKLAILGRNLQIRINYLKILNTKVMVKLIILLFGVENIILAMKDF